MNLGILKTIIIVLGVAAMAVITLIPPWHYTYGGKPIENAGYALLFSPPKPEKKATNAGGWTTSSSKDCWVAKISFDRLIAQYLVVIFIVLFCLACVYLLKQKWIISGHNNG